MRLQIDGASLYFGINAKLNRIFLNKWSRSSPALFPARSSNLTCLDYYLWERVKELTFNVPLRKNMKKKT